MDIFKENSELFRDILEYYEGSILIADTTGKILLCSKGTCDLSGLTQEQLIGASAYELRARGVFSESVIVDALESQKSCITYLTINGDSNRGIYAYGVPIFDRNRTLVRVIAFSQSEIFTEKFIEDIENTKRKMQEAFSMVFSSNNAPSYIAVNPQTQTTFRLAKEVASLDTHIMINGESGTGKEVLAKYIHSCSSRSKEIFVPLNCATIPESLMESEIFGYEKGSFTGANKNGKIGLFELANNGTLFLDEIGELSIQLQPKLLRFLETGEIMKIGGKQVKHLNVRIIAATNRNLLEMVKEGTFREDLYYRLNVMPLTLLPLRQRPEDIDPLANFFLNLYNKKFNKNIHIHPTFMTSMQQYSRPGNVRELKNIIQRYVITNGNASYNILNIPGRVDTDLYKNTTESPVNTFPSNIPVPYKDYKHMYDYKYFRNLLETTHGNITKLSGLSGLHASGIYKKIEKLGLNPKDFQK